MSRQYSLPYFVAGEAYPLQRVEEPLKESWLQELIFANSSMLPLDEIEPVFGPLIPVCRELRTKVGPIDLLFVNDAGLLTLVECKLWRNPQARREVVGQILDYAKELSRWSYSQLQEAIDASLKDATRSLFQIASEQSKKLDERDFIDSVSRNLRRGRFLLLIVGDGIRESVEEMAEFLQEHAHLNFGFALIEIGVFQLPSDILNGYIVQPRIVARTIEIERAVVHIEEGQIMAEPVPDLIDRAATRVRPKKISEQVYYETLSQTNPETAKLLQYFTGRAVEQGLRVESGDNSIMLKYLGDKDYNLGVFRTDGTFQNNSIASRTHDLGQPEIGERYLEELAALIPGGYVNRTENPFYWSVKKAGNRPVTIDEVLAVQDELLELIQQTVDEIIRAEESAG